MRLVKKKRSYSPTTILQYSALAVVGVMNLTFIVVEIFNSLNTVDAVDLAEYEVEYRSGVQGMQLSAVQKLRSEVEELALSLDAGDSRSSSEFEAISNELGDLFSKLDHLMNSSDDMGEKPRQSMQDRTMTPEPTLTPPPQSQSPNPRPSIPIYENCSTSLIRTCYTSVRVLSTDSFQRWSSCLVTSNSGSITNGGSTYLSSVFCSVSSNVEEYDMPVSSTLGYRDDVWSCTCHGLQILNSTDSVFTNFNCQMFATVCAFHVSI